MRTKREISRIRYVPGDIDIPFEKVISSRHGEFQAKVMELAENSFKLTHPGFTFYLGTEYGVIEDRFKIARYMRVDPTGGERHYTSFLDLVIDLPEPILDIPRSMFLLWLVVEDEVKLDDLPDRETVVKFDTWIQKRKTFSNSRIAADNITAIGLAPELCSGFGLHPHVAENVYVRNLKLTQELTRRLARLGTRWGMMDAVNISKQLQIADVAFRKFQDSLAKVVVR